MQGAGKTFIGKLAAALGRTFIDADVLSGEKYNTTRIVQVRR